MSGSDFGAAEELVVAKGVEAGVEAGAGDDVVPAETVGFAAVVTADVVAGGAALVGDADGADTVDAADVALVEAVGFAAGEAAGVVAVDAMSVVAESLTCSGATVAMGPSAIVPTGPTVGIEFLFGLNLPKVSSLFFTPQPTRNNEKAIFVNNEMLDFWVVIGPPQPKRRLPDYELRPKCKATKCRFRNEFQWD